MDIILKSQKLLVVKIINKTKAEFFKDIQELDIIEFSVPLKAAGSGSNSGTRATDIKAYSHKTGDFVYRTFNQMANILKNFEFEELIEC